MYAGPKEGFCSYGGVKNLLTSGGLAAEGHRGQPSRSRDDEEGGEAGEGEEQQEDEDGDGDGDGWRCRQGTRAGLQRWSGICIECTQVYVRM